MILTTQVFYWCVRTGRSLGVLSRSWAVTWLYVTGGSLKGLSWCKAVACLKRYVARERRLQLTPLSSIRLPEFWATQECATADLSLQVDIFCSVRVCWSTPVQVRIACKWWEICLQVVQSTHRRVDSDRCERMGRAIGLRSAPRSAQVPPLRLCLHARRVSPLRYIA